MQMTSESLKVEDFQPLAPLVSVYELKPGMHYLVVAGGKDFDYNLANSLLRDLREHHPELDVFIVATAKPKSLEVRQENVTEEGIS